MNNKIIKKIKNRPIPLEEVLRENFTPEEIAQSRMRAAKIIARMELKEQRIKNQVTQSELAKKAGLPRSTIIRFENGRANPTLVNLNKIANALDMELNIELIPKKK